MPPLILVTPYKKIVTALSGIFSGTILTWGFNLVGALGKGNMNDDTSNFPPFNTGLSGDWKSISCSQHVAAIKSDGSLWAWGFNNQGQLGKGRATTIIADSSPTRIGAANDWKQVACGNNHTVILKNDGTLWSCGSNGFGQLGKGNTVDDPSCYVLAKVGTDSDWKEVSCGQAHTVAIKNDGTLWTWGYNSAGQVGNGTTNVEPHAPMRVGTDSDWKHADCGGQHTFVFKIDGSIWSCGSNSSGQLGKGNAQLSPSDTTLARIGTATDWKDISCGFNFTLAMKNDGTIWSCGVNSNGQLGKGTAATTTGDSTLTKIGNDNDWKYISGGENHSAAIKNDGTLWTWGYNGYGDLGKGNDTNTASDYVPAKALSSLRFSNAFMGGYFSIAMSI